VPSQIVTLPRHIINMIDTSSWFMKAHAFGLRELEIAADEAGVPQPAFRVFASTSVSPGSSAYADNIYALLLQAPGGTLAPPHVLPDHVVRDLLKGTEAALLDLSDLSGHERLEIVAAFDAAHSAAPILRSPRRRSPQTAYEQSLLARAAALQAVIAPALLPFDNKLTSYRRSLRRPGMEIAVTRLDLQAELGAKLALARDGDRIVAGLHSPSRRGSLQTLTRSVHCQLRIFQKIADAIIEADLHNISWFTTDRLQSLHAALQPAYRHAGELRQALMRVLSPFDGKIRTLAQSAESLPEAMAELVSAFDQALWHGIHPLIRAALLHLELARLHPYRDGNGRLARLLMLGCLHEDGLPPLPINTVFEWNRQHYLYAIDRAVTQCDDQVWLQFCLKAAQKAIPLGRFFADALAPQMGYFRESMEKLGESAHTAEQIALFATTTLLGPDAQFMSLPVLFSYCGWRFERSGMIDPVHAAHIDISTDMMMRSDATLWSHPIARYLLQSPPARL
jgi:hypothetical protein